MCRIPDAKLDPQAQEPEFSGFKCANCGDELQLGTEVWRREVEESFDFLYACSVGCLAIFCTEYEVDIDEFEFVVLNENQ